VRFRLVLLLLAFLAAACSDPEPAPPPTTLPPETTTTVPATTTTVLVTVPGRPRVTTTIPVQVQGGGASISGTVSGPQGLVGSATVRVERFVGSEVATTDLSATGGRFSINNVFGGHYRVRAWNRPDLVQVEPEVFFLAADEVKTVDLKVIRVSELSVETTTDPNPPPANEIFTATVFIYAGTVSDEGLLQAIPRASLPVLLIPGPGLSLHSSSTATTDGSGRAAFRLRCGAAGDRTADLVVANQRIRLALPACPG
jgi:hypothetical protein